MAQIEITPLNISGVKIPTNFLDNLLGQQIDYTNLVYPMDLATNPQYCHAIQFSVYDYNYPNVEGIFEQAASAGFEGIQSLMGKISQLPSDMLKMQVGSFSASSVASDVANATKQGVNKAIATAQETTVAGIKQSVTNGLNADLSPLINGPLSSLSGMVGKAPGEMANIFSKYGSIITPGSYKRTIEKNKLASISLYMPDSLLTSFNSQYNDVSLTNAFGIVGYLSNAASDYMSSKDTKDNNLANIINDYGRGGVAAAARAVNEQLGDVVGNALKRVPNPQTQLLYRGIDLRTFQFDFIFTPATAKEAEEIDEIIKTFTYYSLPDITSGTGGQFFIPPQIFKIKFAFMGNDGTAGQIYDVFKNSVGNLLGNQITKIVSGSNPSNDIANAKTAKVMEIGDCVLKDIQVNYAPNGWASYTDGYPVQTTLSLTFGEIELVNKQTPGMQPKNTSSYQNAFVGRELQQAAMDVKNMGLGGR